MRIELFGCSGRTPVIRRFSIEYVVDLSIGREIPRTWIYINIRMSILPFLKKKRQKSVPHVRIELTTFRFLL